MTSPLLGVHNYDMLYQHKFILFKRIYSSEIYRFHHRRGLSYIFITYQTYQMISAIVFRILGFGSATHCPNRIKDVMILQTSDLVKLHQWNSLTLINIYIVSAKEFITQINRITQKVLIFYQFKYCVINYLYQVTLSF